MAWRPETVDADRPFTQYRHAFLSNEVGTVVEAIRLGAQDYLTKPFEKAELDVAMLKCRQKQQLRGNKSLREYCDTITETSAFLPQAPMVRSASNLQMRR